MGIGSAPTRNLEEEIRDFFNEDENINRLLESINNLEINRVPILDNSHLTNVSVEDANDIENVDSVFTFTFNNFDHNHLEPEDQDLLKELITNFISEEFNLPLDRLNVTISNGSTIVDVTVISKDYKYEPIEDPERIRCWEKIGDSILGVSGNSDEKTGFDVQLSDKGNVLVVGGVGFAFGTKGVVRVFHWDSGEWKQLGNDIIGQVFLEMKGFSVTSNYDASIIGIGSPGESSGFPTGLVQVFKLGTDNEWQQLGNDIIGINDGDWLGSSITMDGLGEMIGVGALNHSINEAKPSVGYARVYKFEDNSWEQIGNTIVGETQHDRLGNCVRLSYSGDIFAIGIPGKNSNNGSVEVYNFDGSEWKIVGDPMNGENGERSGEAFEINKDGSVIAIGATLYDEEDKTNIGRVKVFTWDGSNWTQMGSTIVGEAANDKSGVNVSLDDKGKTLAIGASHNDGDESDTNDNRGHVRVFRYFNNEWRQLGEDIDGETSGELLGNGLSLNGDGNILAIGSYDFKDDNGKGVGKTSVYRLLTITKSRERLYLEEEIINILSASEKQQRMVTFLNEKNIDRVPELAIGDIVAANVSLTTCVKDVDLIFTFTLNSFDYQDLEPEAQDNLILAVREFFAQDLVINIERVIVEILNGSAIIDVTILKKKDSYPVRPPLPIRTRSLTQLGNTLYDFIAFAMSFDGKRIVLGDVNQEEGIVKVFEYNKNTDVWDQVGDSFIGVANTNFNLGGQSGVALNYNGDILALTSQSDTKNKITTYKLVNGSWQPFGNQLEEEIKGFGNNSRVFMDYSGHVIAYGNLGNNTGDDRRITNGCIIIYNYIDSSWVKTKTFIGLGDLSRLGNNASFSPDGRYIAFSDLNNDSQNTQVYYMNNDYEWNQIGNAIEANNTFPLDVSLSRDGKRMSIGEMGYKDNNNVFLGRVTVYEYNNNTWEPLGNSIVGTTPGLSAFDNLYFNCLSENGKRLLVGDHKNNSTRGKITLYEYDSNEEEWKPLASISNNEDAEDEFGEGVALSADSSRMLVKITGDDGENNEQNNIGAFKVYKLLTLA